MGDRLATGCGEARRPRQNRRRRGACLGGAAQARRRAGDSRDRSELQGDVRSHRRPRAEWPPHRPRRHIRADSGNAPAADIRKPDDSGLGARHPADSEDTLRFAELSGVRPMIETYPLAKAAEGYARMMSGKAEFRVVLTL